MKPELPRLAALSAVIGQDLSAIRRLDAELTTLRAGVTAAQPAFSAGMDRPSRCDA